MNTITHTAELWEIDDERAIERAGRVCYRSDDRAASESHTQFIARLIRSGHDSVLEHCSATLLLTTDRGISHELVRHRLASYSQESTRYVDQSELQVIRPVSVSDAVWADVLPHLHRTEYEYRRLREAGAPREIARAILPTCTATRIVCTANFREWRHILRLRLDPAAHSDMRYMMALVRDLLREHAPATFGDFCGREG